MSTIDSLLDNNARHAEGFSRADASASPNRHLAVVACMDARVDVAALLGLAPGDAHVIRNAGGLASDDAIRSLAISQRMLGTREIMLIQHTDCGLRGLTEEQVKDAIEQETGARPPYPMGAFEDLEENVRASMARIRTSPFLAHKAVRGFVYEVETGRLREVE